MSEIIFKVPVYDANETKRNDYAEAQVKVKNRDALLRLLDNQDFKDIILDGFMRDFILTKIKSASMVGRSDKLSELMVDNAIAPTVLSSYMSSILSEGGNAENTINEFIAENRGG